MAVLDKPTETRDSELHGDALRRSRTAPRWLMPLVDLVLALTAFALAYIMRYELQIFRPVLEYNISSFEPYWPYAVLYTGWLLFNAWGAGLYRGVRGRPWLEEVYTIANGVTNAVVLMLAISFFLQPLVFSRLMMIYVAVLTVALLGGARVVQRVVQARLRARGFNLQRVVVVGLGEKGRAVLRTMVARKALGYLPVGFLDDDPRRGRVDLGRVRGLGGLENLGRVLVEEAVDHVIIALPARFHERIAGIMAECRAHGVAISVVPDVFQLNLRQVKMNSLDGIPILHLDEELRLPGGSRLFKRALDVLVTVAAAPLWLPIVALVAIAIRMEGPGPILYPARRIGENGQPFTMYKFRSMIPDADRMRERLVRTYELDPRHPKIKDDPRITRVGAFIRRTSLDELPNLFNVLSGQMSLVGPRPPTPDEVRLYDRWHMQRLNVKPGMTGLWQVSGRSDVGFDEMCLLDIYYIENWSLQLDLQILMMTIPRVLMRRGAY
jgi:exopolysaccharide biosynthesis polyprenyl glycosylphosphotransferase